MITNNRRMVLLSGAAAMSATAMQDVVNEGEALKKIERMEVTGSHIKAPKSKVYLLSWLSIETKSKRVVSTVSELMQNLSISSQGSTQFCC